MKAAIVGAGVGGLTTAAHLAKMGVDVDVYDMGAFAGGKMYKYTNNEGLTWDTGPTLISLPDQIKKTFSELNLNPPELLTLNEGSHLLFADGTDWHLPIGKDSLISYFKKKDYLLSQQLNTSLKIAKSIFEFADNFIFNEEPPTVLSLGLKSMASGVVFQHPKTMLRVYSQVIDSLFTNNNMREFFYHFASYIGVQPSVAPGAILSIAHVELGSDIVFPKGGIYSIAKSLYDAAIKYNANFSYQTKVTKAIPLGNEFKNRGWQLYFQRDKHEETKKYDILISNGDPYVASQNWIESEFINKLLNNKLTNKLLRPSESQFVILFDWKDHTEISHHTKIFPKSWNQSFYEVGVELKIPEDPCIYLVWPHATDKNISPRILFISAMAPNLASGHSWDEKSSLIYTNKILDICRKRINLSFNGEVFKTISPLELHERTQSLMGGIYSATSAQFRPMSFHFSGESKVESLFFVGAGIHPGAGVTMVMKSSERIIKRIQKKYKLG
ncbi:phytoene desaturase family protein [Fluviispira multicolorata]|uniref:NAD(P)-binding protein n=1 Tax=Fluviispira multicolorata TaxID=2654512 RepID=A0A833N5G8_9BACT|nr:NAD(P)-binding protein [Fluviispira multicolorata]KAB8033369.1 NAD(P)-binding protein [Fluviispira multicolorata]